MKISFIGAGKVAIAFGKYLNNNNIEVLYYLSRSYESALKASKYVNCNVTENLEKLIDESDYIFITTTDDNISDVVKTISVLNKLDGKNFVHMSGALSSEILDDLKEKNANVYSIHPLQTFSNIDTAVIDLKKTYFSIEGDNLERIVSLIETLGNKYFILSKTQKVKYHLAACIFSNYLVTLMDFGSKILNDINIDTDDGLESMKPLIMSTINNIYNSNTKASLTGPIKRGDTETIIKHLNELCDVDLEVYKSLGKMTTQRLVDEDKKEQLMKLWKKVKI